MRRLIHGYHYLSISASQDMIEFTSLPDNHRTLHRTLVYLTDCSMDVSIAVFQVCTLNVLLMMTMMMMNVHSVEYVVFCLFLSTATTAQLERERSGYYYYYYY